MPRFALQKSCIIVLWTSGPIAVKFTPFRYTREKKKRKIELTETTLKIRKALEKLRESGKLQIVA